MEEKLERIFGNLQRLEIQPSEHNVELLADCFATLRSIYTETQKGPQGAAEAADGQTDAEAEKTPTGAEKGEE